MERIEVTVQMNVKCTYSKGCQAEPSKYIYDTI